MAAEVHLIGTLVGASEFPESTLCCKWSIIAGEEWNLIEGETFGQTHVDQPLDKHLTVWSHPIGISN